jgi:hypothetical protein
LLCREPQDDCENRKAAGKAGEHKTGVAGNLQPERGRTGARHTECGDRHPEEQRSYGSNHPDCPIPHQHPAGRKEATLDAACSKAEASEEINKVMQRAAELECERPERRPGRWSEDDGQWDIRDGGCQEENRKIPGRTGTGCR